MLDLSMPTSFEGFTRSISVILVSEIGDRTFIIAAILSMRHSRAVIYAGALSALATMSLLSALLGTIVPSLLPKRWTTLAAAILFFFFGARMLQEGLEMDSGEKGREKMEEEMREVQKEVEEAVAEEGTTSMVDMEEGASRPSTVQDDEVPPPSAGASKRGNKQDQGGIVEGAKNLVSLCFSPIFVQAFILTFLAEWGDRSQITTIALAAAHNVWIVTLGTTLGHSVCTLGAVLGGRWISQHISIKHVMLSGAVLFLIFGVAYGYEFWTFVDEPIQIPSTVV
ncbi:putative ribosome biosynthesis protein GDT1 [Sporobolomyces koalae]|uniref:putative ribosome biosynthesis protein GDT1 n=1 Tax=Sporobolomyces koalae TaxID=500713 RepID=UPI00317679ED